MRKIIFVFFLFLCLTGCDYEYYYYYYVENELNSPDKEIIVSYQDSSYLIPFDQTVRFYSHSGGASGKNHYPEDIRYRELRPYWQLDSLTVSVNDTLIDYNFADKEKWSFKSENGTGIYTLIITEQLLGI